MNDLLAQLLEFPLHEDLRANSLDFLEQLLREEPLIVDKISVQGLTKSFTKTAAISEYFSSFCLNKPEFVHYLLDNALLTSAPFDTRSIKIVSSDTNQLNAAMTDLRVARHLGMMRIMWREFGGLATLEETLADLSLLADQLIRQAVATSLAMLSEQFGLPGGVSAPDELCVIAMGKLGGGELNMSSDVDLIFLHGHSGQTSGARKIEHQEFFTKQTKQTVDLLSRMTADGFVYRTDTRLRPFGQSGRACVSFSALELYLSLHGREWERYAYIKQRLVAGSDAQSHETIDILRPFVYRKYLDFGVFDSLREMQNLISTEVLRQDLHDNIKRGPGGIRELEFIVQTQQLVYGGKQTALRTSSFHSALDQLQLLDIMPMKDTQQIGADYNFLRRVENGLQGIRDQQTHSLPSNTLDQQRLALLMGHSDWVSLKQEISGVRKRVQRYFEHVSLGPNRSSNAPNTGAAERAWKHSLEQVQLEELPDLAQGPMAALLTLGRGGLRDRLEPIGRRRLDELVPKLMKALESVQDPEILTARLVKLLDGIGRRSAYFALLNENDHVLQRVISICQQSPMLAKQLAASPMLLDTLADPRGSSFELTKAGLKQRAERVFAHLDPLDEEQCLLALREFRLSAVFDVAVADIQLQLPVMKISDRLTEIAELILAQALRIATSQMQDRYGAPSSSVPSHSEAAFAVVGYGKLGGIELAYGSDLDLVFLYDDGGAGVTDGEESIDNAQYFSKLARRFIHILTVPTAFGALYEVDMRLRPSGRSGLLVSRIEAFEKYQREKAWTWEHQALLRARGIEGDKQLLGKFEQLRIDVVSQPVPIEKLRDEVVSMRLRMKKELDQSAANQFDLKHGDGGLVDLEFLVQFLVLQHCAQYPDLVEYSDNVRQLEALERVGLLGKEAQIIKDIYLTYRQRLHRRSLSVDKTHEDVEIFSKQRTALLAILSHHELNWQN